MLIKNLSALNERTALAIDSARFGPILDSYNLKKIRIVIIRSILLKKFDLFYID